MIKATYRLYNLNTQMKGNEQSVFKTKQHPMLESCIVLEVLRTYPTWRMGIQVFFKWPQPHQQPVIHENLKLWGKGENMV